MILRGTYKPDAFIKAIAKHWSGVSASHDCYYLGAGYWRMEITTEGACLINPGYSPSDIEIVERAIAILCHFDWKPNGTV